MFIGIINMIINIYRIQAYDSIMCGYFCIGFIDLMLKGKSLKILKGKNQKFQRLKTEV